MRLPVHSRLVLAAALVIAAVQPSLGSDAPARPLLKIGLIKSLLVASNSNISMAAPLGEMLGSQMGCRLQFVECADQADMAKKLKAGDIQLGVVHGLEYAWLKKDTPDIEPLALALGQDIKLQARLLVRTDSKFADVRDLKDKTLIRPMKSLNHNNLFLTKVVSEVCPECDKFFGAVKVKGSVDSAIDALIDGEGDVVVVDAASWKVYEERKPARAAKVKSLVESGNFPTAAVLHYPGGLSPITLRQIRTGFLSIHQKPLGQQMLVFWRLTKFVPVTEEFNDVCRESLKDYPTPMQPVIFQAKK